MRGVPFFITEPAHWRSIVSAKKQKISFQKWKAFDIFKTLSLIFYDFSVTAAIATD